MITNLNEIYILYRVTVFCTMKNFLRQLNFVWTSWKVGILLDRYEPKLNSPIKFWCISS